MKGAVAHWPESRTEWVIFFICVIIAVCLFGYAYLVKIGRIG